MRGEEKKVFWKYKSILYAVIVVFEKNILHDQNYSLVY
jgi:hypothetical protein